MNTGRTLVYPVEADKTPSEATVLALARQFDRCPDTVETDLQEHVDTDALDKLTSTPGVVVEFPYDGHEIRVCSETQIEVRPA